MLILKMFRSDPVKKIILPNNNFGTMLMLAAILLIIVSTLTVSFWLVSLLAPWWVALPCSLLASLLTFLFTVKPTN